MDKLFWENCISISNDYEDNEIYNDYGLKIDLGWIGADFNKMILVLEVQTSYNYDYQIEICDFTLNGKNISVDDIVKCKGQTNRHDAIISISDIMVSRCYHLEFQLFVTVDFHEDYSDEEYYYIGNPFSYDENFDIDSGTSSEYSKRVYCNIDFKDKKIKAWLMNNNFIPDDNKIGRVVSVTNFLTTIEITTDIYPGREDFSTDGDSIDPMQKQEVDFAINIFKKLAVEYLDKNIYQKFGYHIHIHRWQCDGHENMLTLPILISLFSTAYQKPVLNSMIVLGNINEYGDNIAVEDLEDIMKYCCESNARTVLLPVESANEVRGLSSAIINRLNFIIYENANDAIRKIFDLV